jgi:predicted nucleotidyltransferase component of viral defense system
MSPVQRASTAGRAYLDLQQMARLRGRPTQELLLTYVLERFLFRVSRSVYRDRLVLKGGMLLAVLGSRRPTGDVDLLARAIDNDVAAIADVVRTVLSVAVDDGVTYQLDEMTTQVIRDAALYSGVRLSVPSRIERAKVVLRLDVNVGDPVTPHPVDVQYPALLDRPFHLLGYPLATILAEKVVTIIERGVATTRERDFADVVVLSRRYQIAASELLAAMNATAEYREAVLRPLAALLGSLGTERQQAWSTFIASAGLEGLVPGSYSDAINLVAMFIDPLLDGSVQSGQWDPHSGSWVKSPADSERA